MAILVGIVAAFSALWLEKADICEWFYLPGGFLIWAIFGFSLGKSLFTLAATLLNTAFYWAVVAAVVKLHHHTRKP